MKFTARLPITGIVERVSKKTNNPYVIVNFLNEEGQSFGAMYKGVHDIVGQFKQMDLVEATFNLRTGQYMNLELVSLVLVD